MNYPSSFIDRIKKQLGSETEAFFEALSGDPPVSVRINQQKEPLISMNFEAEGRSVLSSIRTVAILSENQKSKIRNIPWCSTGHYLLTRPSFTLDPLFHAGCYYVQEAASMFIEEIFRQHHLENQPLLVLDACAAPGGKSTHLASLINKKSLLISNETISSRVSVLKENIIKWGTCNVIVTNNDPSDFTNISDSSDGLFDVILIDAPCSGEGLFRKDKDAIKQWSEENCNICVNRQRRILSALYPALKPGGILIYCTCTFNPEENEENIKWLTEEYGMESIPLIIPEEWDIVKQDSKKLHAYSFHPHRTKSEGFFISVLRKNDARRDAERTEGKSKSFRKKKSRPALSTFSLLKQHPLANAMIKEESGNLYINSDKIYLLSAEMNNFLELFSQKLNIRYSGLPVAEIKNNDLIPQHELAMSVHLNKENFVRLSLSYEEALSFLRRETSTRKINEKGWLLAEYKDVPLGWLKSTGSRLNNYYPMEWRVRI